MKKLIIAALAFIPLFASAQAQRVRHDNSLKPTYVACSAASANTAASDFIVIEAGPSNVTRIRSVWLYVGAQTTPGFRTFTVARRTSASSSGTLLTGGVVDSVDAAFTGTVRVKPTAGSAGATILALPVWIPSATGSTSVVIWPPPQVALGIPKDLVVPAGAVNGIAVSDAGATGAVNAIICAEWTEEGQ